MAGISRRVRVFIVILIATSGIAPLILASEAAPARAGDPPPIHYDIGLDVQANNVEAITVRASVQIGDDGIVDFKPPHQPPLEVHAERGQLDTSTADRWRVTGAPGSDAVLAWRSAKPDNVPGPDWAIWTKVVARPESVFAFAGAFLAIPMGRDTRQVTAALSLPPGWQASSHLGEGPLTVRFLKDTSYLASRRLDTATRQVDANTTLRVGAIGMPHDEVDGAATVLAASLRAMEGSATPQGAPKHLTLNLVRYDQGDGFGVSTSGPSAIVLQGGKKMPRWWLFYVVRDFGQSDDAPGDARNAWFTQGVGTYRVAAALLASGDFDAVAFARHIDQTLDSYGGSPLRRASNARIVEEYDRIQEMHDLPATRGELFAWLIDGRLRDATGGRKHLTDALQRMDTRHPDPGAALIAAVAAEGGGDITALYQRYIVDGDLLQLPPDALGPCLSIGTVAYDYGWQVQHVFARPAGSCR